MKHGNNNDDIANRNNTTHTNAAYLTSKVVNLSTNKSLQPEQMNSSVINTTSASSSADVAYNNNSSTLPEGTEDVTSISLTSPRMIIHSTPRSMTSKHARVSVKNSCNWPAKIHDKTNSSCTLSINNNNNNSSKKNDTEIVGSSNLMNTRNTYTADKVKTSVNSKVQNANANVRNVQGPPTLHLYRGAKTSASSLPEANKEEKEVQDTLYCEYAHKTTDQSKSTVTSQYSNSELPNEVRESGTNNRHKDDEAVTHFTRESNELHHMPMTGVTNDYNGDSKEENKLREKIFIKAGTVEASSDAEDIQKNASEEKPERQACTNNTENNEQVIVHEGGDRKVQNEDQDEDDEVRMTDDRIRK